MDQCEAVVPCRGDRKEQWVGPTANQFWLRRAPPQEWTSLTQRRRKGWSYVREIEGRCPLLNDSFGTNTWRVEKTWATPVAQSFEAAKHLS
jgi:hypothetical protein